MAGHAKNLMKSSLALLVSPSKDGNNQGCGTLAYSNALQQAVIATNRHVVVDDKSGMSCRRKVVVKTWSGQTINVSKWLAVEEPAGVDIAVGLTDNELNLPLLNFSSRYDVDGGMKLSALSLRNSVQVALSAQVIKIKQHEVTTDAGGALGYSGTGYVDYLGRLSAIHIGQSSATEFSGMGNNISAYCDKDHLKEDGFCEIQIVEAQCASSLRLGATGYGGYIDACLALAGQAANLPAPSPNEQTCMEGWRMHRTGRLDAPVEYIEDCVDYFAGRHTNGSLCKKGWTAELASGSNATFVEHCLNSRRKAQSKQTCRTGWKVDRARLADACMRYMELASRNPRANAVAAWVIDAFVLADLSTRVLCSRPLRRRRDQVPLASAAA